MEDCLERALRNNKVGKELALPKWSADSMEGDSSTRAGPQGRNTSHKLCTCRLRFSSLIKPTMKLVITPFIHIHTDNVTRVAKCVQIKLSEHAHFVFKGNQFSLKSPGHIFVIRKRMRVRSTCYHVPNAATAILRTSWSTRKAVWRWAKCLTCLLPALSHTWKS